MTLEQLWEQHTFQVLLADLFKARKDPAMGQMRLKVLLDYLADKGLGAKVEPPKVAQAVTTTETISEPELPEDRGVPLIPKDLRPFETVGEKYQRMEELLIDRVKGKEGTIFKLALPIDFDAARIPEMLEKHRLPFVVPEGPVAIAGRGNRAPMNDAGNAEVQAMMDAKIREQFGQWAVDDGGDKWLVTFHPKQ